MISLSSSLFEVYLYGQIESVHSLPRQPEKEGGTQTTLGRSERLTRPLHWATKQPSPSLFLETGFALLSAQLFTCPHPVLSPPPIDSAAADLRYNFAWAAFISLHERVSTVRVSEAVFLAIHHSSHERALRVGTMLSVPYPRSFSLHVE